MRKLLSVSIVLCFLFLGGCAPKAKTSSVNISGVSAVGHSKPNKQMATADAAEMAALPLYDGSVVFEKNNVPETERLFPAPVTPSSAGNPSMYGYINKQGTVCISGPFGFAFEFSDGLALVELPDQTFCFINTNGEAQFGVRFSYAANVCEKRTYVWNENRNGYDILDIEAGILYPLAEQYSIVSFFSEGLLAVKNNEQLYGYCNTFGQLVIPCQYEYAMPFHEGLAAVGENGHVLKYINKEGNVVINTGNVYDPTFDGYDRISFSENVAYNGKDFINQEGTVIISLGEYVCDTPFSEGYAAVLLDDKIGFMNKAGEIVVAPQYDKVNGFSEGLAAVYRSTEMSDSIYEIGFIDTEGNLVIDFQFSQIESGANGVYPPYNFKDGIAWVIVAGENAWQGYINKQGAMVYKNK